MAGHSELRMIEFKGTDRYPDYKRLLMNENDIDHLKTTISIAWRAREKGNHPFGSLLVDENNRVVLEAENTVVTERDLTGHAETNLVRLATKQFSAEQLAGFTLYASTEPCAMCSGAIFWSHIGRVVFALGEKDLYDIIGPSPEQLILPCRDVFAHGARQPEVLGPVAALEMMAREVHHGFWTMEG